MHCNEMTPHQGGLSHAATAGSKDPHDWALFFRFLIISTVATIASIGNIFTISAIIIDDLLRKKGNSFLVSLTLADLLMTTVVLPASSVAILSQMEDSENLCRLQYAMAAMSCVTAGVFTSFVGVENFLRLRTLRKVEKHRRRRQQNPQQQHHQHHHHQHPVAPLQRASGSGIVSTSLTTSTASGSNSRALTVHMLPEPRKPYRCSQFQVTVLNLTVWVVSGCLVLFHVWNMPQLMYTTCGFLNEKELTRETLIHSLLAYALCFIAFHCVGGLGFLKCVCIMKSWDRPKPYLISREFALVTSNCWNWFARFLIWCPSLLLAIVTHSQQSVLLTSSSAASSISSSSLESGLPLNPSSSYSSSSSLSNLASIVSTTVSPLLLFGSNGLSNPSNIGGIVGGAGGGGGNSNNSSSSSTSRMSASEVISLQRLLLWPAILPPCLSSLINAISNRDFRRCYIQLFHYCCCKTSVALTRRSRDNLRGGSDVRVHIIPGYNIYTPSTGHFSEVTQTPPRFNTFKCGSLIACRRDVYEL